MARMTLAELQQMGVVGRDAYSPLFSRLGLAGDAWRTAPGGNDAAGNAVYWDNPNAQAMQAANGFTFDWQNTGTGNTGTLSAYDPTGNLYGQFAQTDTSFGQDLLEFGALASAGFGGAGLLGLGPLGGLLGGAGAAGSAGGISVPASELAANVAAGSALTPAGVAGASLPGASAFGSAAAGAFGGGAGVAGGLGSALGGLLPTGGAMSNSGFWTGALQAGGSLVGALVSSNAANKAAGAQTAAAQAGIAAQQQQFEALQKVLSPYVGAGVGALQAQQNLVGLGGAGAQAQAIEALRSGPEYQALLQQGENRILANASATGGLRGGNVQGALGQFGPAMLSQLINDQYSRLGGLTSIGANAAAGVGNAGMQTGSNVANLLGQAGAANAGAALARGGAINQGLGGLTNAFGQYLGRTQQQAQPVVGGNTPFGGFTLGGF